MGVTGLYVLSQVFVIINYVLLIATYQLKNRKTILIVNFISTIAVSISYLLLSAYTGFAMAIVALIRNILFLKNDKKSKKNSKKDIAILLFLYAISILFAIITYDGFFSLMPVLVVILYTYSIWQKNTKIYKILGVPVSIGAIIYNLYINSICGVIFESFLAVSAIIGLLRENINNKSVKNKKYRANML